MYNIFNKKNTIFMDLEQIVLKTDITDDLERVVKMIAEVHTDIIPDQILADMTIFSLKKAVPYVQQKWHNNPLVKEILPPQFIVAYYEDSPIGILGYGEEKKGFNMFEMYYGTVLAKYQKNGIGKLLAQTALKNIKEHSGATPKQPAFVTVMARTGYTKNALMKLGFEVTHSIHNGTETLHSMLMTLF